MPISATPIREASRERVGWVEPHVARWFQPRLVCIPSGGSAGKTMLARDLAAAFDAPWIPGYGRLDPEQPPDPAGYRWSEVDFVRIAERQQGRFFHPAPVAPSRSARR